MSPQTTDLIAYLQNAIAENNIDMTKTAPEQMPRGRVIGEKANIQAKPAASRNSVSPRGDGVKR